MFLAASFTPRGMWLVSDENLTIVPSLMFTLDTSHPKFSAYMEVSYMEGFIWRCLLYIWDVRGSAFLSSSNLDTLCLDSGTCISSLLLAKSRNLLCWTKGQDLVLTPQMLTHMDLGTVGHSTGLSHHLRNLLLEFACYPHKLGFC